MSGLHNVIRLVIVAVWFALLFIFSLLVVRIWDFDFECVLWLACLWVLGVSCYVVGFVVYWFIGCGVSFMSLWLWLCILVGIG